MRYQLKTRNASGITAADFNGDQKPDIALLSGSNVISVLTNNGFGCFGREKLWSGGATLQTITADLNNDQKADIISGFGTSKNGYTKILFNTSSEPLNTGNTEFDFDGDRKTDISIFRPSTGQWWYLRSSDSANRVFQFGISIDKLVPADYTGDGKTDIAVWRPASGQWYILRSENASFYALQFGLNGDIPAPGDFDGDGKTGPAIFRQSNATWYLQQSASGFSAVGFGISTDQPVPGVFDQ